MSNEAIKIPKKELKRKSKGMRKHIRKIKQEQRKDYIPTSSKK